MIKTNCIKTNCTYVSTEARFGLSAVLPVPAAWPITDAVRPHVMAAQLKRNTDVFPSGTRGTDPPV